ncbi:tRNA dihydrouridine synthase DusB [bacterium]|nr:tRNA dihydrouridine synthase DusB [bacterium]
MNKIGNVELRSKLILAPMAGVTNEAFFYVVRKYNDGLLCSEMVSDKGLIYHNEKTLSLLKFDESLRPFSIQIFGNKKEELASAAKIVEEIAHPDIIDINMGCSVPKILRSGAGAALLKDPDYVYEIVKEVVHSVTTPVTVKIRSGFDHKHKNYLEVAKAIERAGASAIAIHPRTKTDLFKGNADWMIIKEIKDNLSIPVIGNGDIKTPEDAKRMLDETGCDYVMVGRAAMGNPFIFKEINDYLTKGTYEKTNNLIKFDTMLEHFHYLKELKGEKIAVMEMRTHAAWYVKGMKDSAVFKSTLNETTTQADLEELILNYKEKIINYERK